MRTPPTTTSDSMGSSLALSAGLHLLFFLFLYFGLPKIFTPLPSHHTPVSFEIVEIADMTNTRIQEPEEQPKPPAPPPAPAPPQQNAAPIPPAVKPPEKIEALALPKPAEKPKPPQEVKPKENDFSKLLRDVAKLKPREQTKPSDVKSDSKATEEQKSAAPALSTRLTISEEDALRRQVSQCWNMPIGARDAENLIVEIVIDVNPDRTVQKAEIVDQGRYASDSFFRAAAEAGLRALRNPRCSPLELPSDKYDQWKRIDFTFDPRDML